MLGKERVRGFGVVAWGVRRYTMFLNARSSRFSSFETGVSRGSCKSPPSVTPGIRPYARCQVSSETIAGLLSLVGVGEEAGTGGRVRAGSGVGEVG
eukprot:COSAG02_NODE_7847_length_2820_cov_18.421536_3_plen_95_part_01